jgi:hypothetical protein
MRWIIAGFVHPQGRVPFELKFIAWLGGVGLTWHPFWLSIHVVAVVYAHLPYPTWLPWDF